MAGGFIGIVYEPSTGNTSELVTNVTAPGTFTKQTGQTAADIYIVGGGGGASGGKKSEEGITGEHLLGLLASPINAASSSIQDAAGKADETLTKITSKDLRFLDLLTLPQQT